MKRFVKFMLILIMLFALSGCQYLSHFAPIPEGNVSLEVINHMTYELVPGTVFIKNDSRTILEQQSGKTGSGFIFDEDETHYYILTNHHVIEHSGAGVQILTVVDYLNYEYEATLLSSSDDYDLAILKVKKYEKHQAQRVDDADKYVNLYVFSLAQSNPVKNDIVFAISSPNGQRNAISAGRVNKFVEVATGDGNSFDFEVIAHGATIDSGSSGSLIVNEDYQVVGINYAVGTIIINEIESKHALAIPIDKVHEYIEANSHK